MLPFFSVNWSWSQKELVKNIKNSKGIIFLLISKQVIPKSPNFLTFHTFLTSGDIKSLEINRIRERKVSCVFLHYNTNKIRGLPRYWSRGFVLIIVWFWSSVKAKNAVCWFSRRLGFPHLDAQQKRNVLLVILPIRHWDRRNEACL